MPTQEALSTSLTLALFLSAAVFVANIIALFRSPSTALAIALNNTRKCFVVARGVVLSTAIYRTSVTLFVKLTEATERCFTLLHNENKKGE